jgi:ribonucleotide reductase beta subunit family protein with ferritin-like domain
MSSTAMDKISYADLYQRWERGNWQATAIDFTADRTHWRQDFSDLERRAALWNYSMFFHGEDAVADDLAPFIDAAPREEQKYFLTTQQVDEARHSVFFHRFMHEVVERGDGTVADALRATEPDLTWGFRKTFEMLDQVTDELRRDRSRTALARAVTMYHFIVEATLAQPGQHFIGDYLERKDVLPGFREGMHHVAQDEQRHIGFGVKLLHDLAREDPAEVPDAVADLLREVFPVSVAVFVPPNWDRRYTECFGFTLEEIYTEGARSFESKLRMAGLPLESLPGPQVYPYDLPVEQRATRALAMLRAGFLGEKNGGAARDPESMALLFDSVRRAVDPRTAPEGPLTLQWEFPDAEPWHLRLDNGSTAAAPGRAPEPDVELRVAFDDWVDVIAGRLDPKRAVATRRLRLKGSPRALWRARGVFSAS